MEDDKIANDVEALVGAHSIALMKSIIRLGRSDRTIAHAIGIADRRVFPVGEVVLGLDKDTGPFSGEWKITVERIGD